MTNQTDNTPSLHPLSEARPAAGIERTAEDHLRFERDMARIRASTAELRNTTLAADNARLREALHDAASVLGSVVDVHPEWPRAARFLTNARAALAMGGKEGA
jgi:hypothetical protein